MSESYIDIAVKYAKAGIKIFPCKPSDKSPLTKNGFKNASSDVGLVKRWWKKNPDALIGAPCEGQFSVIDVDLSKGQQAFASFGKIHEYTCQTKATASTLNNGHHYYFKPDNEVVRKVGFIYAIDSLGVGGYAILPDGNRYMQRGSLDSFISQIRDNKLPELPSELKNHLTGVREIESLSQYREQTTPKRSKSTAKKNEEIPEEPGDDVSAVIEAETSASLSRVYEGIGANHGYEDITYTGDPIFIGRGEMTGKMFNSILFNKDVQKRLASYVGVALPKNGEMFGRPFRSLLPGHTDNNPSMSSRWVRREGGGWGLIVRDFSDHNSDEKIDYNLTRIFMNVRYGKNYRKPSPTEFVVWTMKLMSEAGVIDFERPELKSEITHMTKGQKKAAQGFLDLVGLKSTWSTEEVCTCYSQKFAAAWTGVSTETVNKMKAAAIKFGLMEKTGEMHGEGAMRTPLFRLGSGVVKREEIRNIRELITAVNSESKRKSTNGRKKLGSRKQSPSDTTLPVNKGISEKVSPVMARRRSCGDSS